MPHATEGELHAWLDGALSAIDPEAPERLSAHLERCPDCRARLERERSIRDRSAELMGAAWPDSAAPPPFEAVARRAGDDAGRGERGPRLAWAASVVVALAAGWMGHALLRGGGGPPTDASRAPATAVPARQSAANEVERQTATDDADRPPAPGAAVGGDARGEAVRPADAPQAADRERAIAQAKDEAAEAEPARARRDALGPPAEEEAIEVAPTSVGDVELRSSAYPTFADAAWRVVPEPEAAGWIGGRVLRVPGLAVVDVAISAAGGGRLVRVRQTLPGGEPLELVQEAAPGASGDEVDSAASTEEGAAREGAQAATGAEVRAPGVASVAVDSLARAVADSLAKADAGPPIRHLRVRVGDVWITLTAPVAPDSLRAIGFRIGDAERP